MIKDMIQFFEDRHKAIPLMVERRPFDVTPPQIKAAAEDLYNGIVEKHQKHLVMKDGKTVKNIDIAREVFAIAKSYANDSKQFEEDIEVFQKSKEIITDLKRQLIAANTAHRTTQAKLKVVKLKFDEKYGKLLKIKKWRERILAITAAISAWSYLGYTYYEVILEAIKCLIPM